MPAFILRGKGAPSVVLNHDTHAKVDVEAILKDDLEGTCAIVYHR